MKSPLYMTLEELRQLDYKRPKKNQKIYSVIIVPMNTIHESGYSCMRFVMLDGNKNIIGVVGDYCDVLNLNGIGGYGDYETFQQSIKTGQIDVAGWSIDCLPISKCLRLFNTSGSMKVPEIICSNFEIYAVKGGKRKNEKN